MFIRKSKVLKEIEAMKEDSRYYIELWKNRDTEGDNARIQALKAEIDALDTLRFYLEHKLRWRKLQQRNK